MLRAFIKGGHSRAAPAAAAPPLLRPPAAFPGMLVPILSVPCERSHASASHINGSRARGRRFPPSSLAASSVDAQLLADPEPPQRPSSRSPFPLDNGWGSKQGCCSLLGRWLGAAAHSGALALGHFDLQLLGLVLLRAWHPAQTRELLILEQGYFLCSLDKGGWECGAPSSRELGIPGAAPGETKGLSGISILEWLGMKGA